MSGRALVVESGRAREMREAGMSVKEIAGHLGVARSSVSVWCRDVALTPDQVEILLARKRSAGMRGSLRAAANKKAEAQARRQRLLETGHAEVGPLSRRDRFVAGVALFVAEGDKRDGDVALSNSDPRLIRFFVAWLPEFCDVPATDLRAQLYLHEGYDAVQAGQYWSKMTGIPQARFRAPYVVPRGPQTKSRTPYGVLSVRMYSRTLHRKIQGWIQGLVGSVVVFRGSSMVEQSTVTKAALAGNDGWKSG